MVLKISKLEVIIVKTYLNEKILLQIQSYLNVYEPDAVRHLQCCTALKCRVEKRIQSLTQWGDILSGRAPVTFSNFHEKLIN